MKKIIIICSFLIFALASEGQKFVTKNGHIRFYSETPVETIEAHNRQVSSALDIATGDFVFKVLIKSFEFEKALMQEHFNENYLESDKYPDATFTGRITNLSSMDLTKDGTYNAEIEGLLKIHNETRKVNEKGTFRVADGKITGKSVFVIHIADYNIRIPKTVINNIAEDIEVTVDVNLESLGK
jgi:polyisoprenoid-binding protein YceI